jgi:hypothetical protein
MAGGREAASIIGTIMSSNKWTTALALAGGLALAGCGKPQTDTQPAVSDAPAAAAADSRETASPVEPATSAPATNEALSGGAEFARKSEASPFAQADLALKESYNRSLIAFQIGDYPRAANELQDLAKTPDLAPEQKRAVQKLLAETLKAAPELAAGNSAAAAAGSVRADAPPVFPLASPETAQTPKNLPESPFSTADPAVKESFARARAAYDIGNYEVALAELRELSTNAQLNFQQKYAVQSLLDSTPQAPPAPVPPR